MICDNYNRLNNCKKSYKAYLTKKESSIMYCENEHEIDTGYKPKTKAEKRILKYNKLNSENNSELNGTTPLISKEVLDFKPMIQGNNNNNDLLKLKPKKNSCLIEESPFYIHKVSFNKRIIISIKSI